MWKREILRTFVSKDCMEGTKATLRKGLNHMCQMDVRMMGKILRHIMENVLVKLQCTPSVVKCTHLSTENGEARIVSHCYSDGSFSLWVL